MGRNTEIKRTAALISIIALIIGLLPIIALGRFDYPSADDFSGSMTSSNLLRQGASAWDLLVNAIVSVGGVYVSWQGNYTCSFLLNVSPALWGDTAYHLVPLFAALTLCACVFFFVFGVVRFMARGDKWDALLISSVVCIMCIQFMPSPVEGLFWYAGAATYTGTWSLALLALGFAARYLYGERRSPLALAASVVFILLAGGANTQTSFISVAVYALYLLWTLRFDRSRSGAAALFAGLAVAGFALVMLSPGNAMRVDFFGLQGVRRDLLTVITCAFKDGALLVRNSIGIGLALCALALAPALWRLAANSKCRFRLPIAVVVFAFCFLSAGFAPTAYAYGAAGTAPGRYQNLQFFLLCLLLVVCEFYIFGYAQRYEALRDAFSKAASFLNKKPVKSGVFAALLCVAVLWASTSGAFTAKTAFNALNDGSAAAYGAQMQALVDQCRDPAVETPTSPPFTVRPILLWYNGPTTEGIWVNEVMANFYGKESLVITDG